MAPRLAQFAARVGLVVVLAVVVCASFASASVRVDTDVWASLHRPLHIPRLRAGAPCPRTKTTRAVPHVGYTLGRGPVYPVLGFSDPPPVPKGVVHLSDGGWKWGWDWIKTLWAFSPRYRGPVLIRGRGLDGRSPVRFLIIPHRYRELRVPARQKRTWSYLPSNSGVHHAGCYGFQMDGTSFSRVVIFKIVNR